MNHQEKYNLYIETERLILRPFTIDDIVASYQLNLDKDVSRYTSDGGVVSMKEMARRIKEDVLGDYQKYGFGRLAVELKDQKRFIGFAGIKYLEYLREVDLGYRFEKAQWGKGIATESAKACLQFGFETLGLDRIIAMVIPENIGSVRVLEKLNFQFDQEIIDHGNQVHVYQLEKN